MPEHGDLGQHDRHFNMRWSCPSCGRQLEQRAVYCGACGLPLHGPWVERLQELERQQWQLSTQRRQIDGLLGQLEEERRRIVTEARVASGPGSRVMTAALPRHGATDPASPSPASSTPPFELSLLSLRNFLLWTGAILIGFAGIGFAGYEWTHLGPAGRAAVLLMVAAAALGAAPLVRRRRPMSGEAIAAVGLALIVIDWALLRRAGAGASISTTGWWCLGMLCLGLVGTVLSSRFVAGRASVALALLGVLPLALATVPSGSTGVGATWWQVAALAGIATVDVLLARCLGRRPGWAVSEWLLLAGAGAATLWTYAAAGTLVREDPAGLGLLLTCLVIACTAAAPVAVRVLFCKDASQLDELGGPMALPPAPFAAAASASLLGAVLYGLSAFTPSMWVGPLDVLLGGTALLVGSRATAPDRVGVRLIGAILLASGAMATSIAVLAHSPSWQGVASLAAGTLLVAVFSRFDAGAAVSLRAIALAAAVLGSATALLASLVAMVIPTAWWAHGWKGELAAPSSPFWALWPRSVPTTISLALLGVVAIVVLLCGTASARRRPSAAAVIGCAALGVLSLAGTPLAFGLSIGDAIVMLLAGGSILVAVSATLALRGEAWRGSSIVCASMSGAIAVPALGYAAATPTSTVVGLAVVLGWAVLLAALCRHSLLGDVGRIAATVFVLALAGTAAAARGVPASTTGTLVTIVAACLLVALRAPRSTPGGAWSATGPVCEGVAIAGLAICTLTQAITPSWTPRALDLTIGAVALALASVRPGRPAYRLGAALLAVFATWAWLAATHVALLEAYTWSAAAILLGIGVVFLRRASSAEQRVSWVAYGPGLLVAIAPSAAVGIAHANSARLIAVTVLGMVYVALGARRRLQAPFVLGIGSLLAVGIHVAAPAITKLPTWLLAGAAGVVLLWLGATAERRIAAVRRMAEWLRRLG